MSRDTTTGIKYEEKVNMAYRHRGAIDLGKHKLYTYLQSIDVDWRDYLSARLLPDEAYLDGTTLYIYEKKYQQVGGSADEKPQTCGFKISQFKKLAEPLNATNVIYTYILSDWFKQPKYRDVLQYIDDTPDCRYEFQN